MAFTDFPQQTSVVTLLQRSLERGRLAHAYLFAGGDLEEMEGVARVLAKALNCEAPPSRSKEGLGLDCCDACVSCRKIESGNHPDVLSVRPESKLRVITIDQMRALMQTVHLKPTQARFKVAFIVAADRLNPQAANAFLKTLEEPPADSVLILLSADPQRLVETLVSRCLRLAFSGETGLRRDATLTAWVREFSAAVVAEKSGLLSRYRVLAVLLDRLGQVKTGITERLNRLSPLERYDDVEPELREKWEVELDAAIEAEYRRQRSEVLRALQWWLRDVWLATQSLGEIEWSFPELAEAAVALGRRLSTPQALENLHTIEGTHRLLGTNVQEALTLEVGLLKLHL